MARRRTHLINRRPPLPTPGNIERWLEGRLTSRPCAICGDEPQSHFRLMRFWDADSGWRYDALCYDCALHSLHVKPAEVDPAYDKRDHQPSVELADWFD